MRKSTGLEPYRGRPHGLLRSYAAWILLVALVVVATAGLFAQRQKVTYTSTTEVLSEPLIFPNGPQQPNMATEREIVSSGAVVDIAARKLNLSPKEVAAGTSVIVPVDTSVLQIRQSAGEPHEAQRRSAALASAYVEYRTLTALVRGTSTTVAGADTAGATARPTQSSFARVITPASLPGAPSRTQSALIIGIGVIVGCGLGLVTALVLDHLSDRLRDVHDVDLRSGRPTLVTVPPPPKKTYGPVVRTAPASAGADSYRYLWERVRQVSPSDTGRVVVITSPGEGEGKTATAVNLALAAVAAGQRVTLVDGNSRSPHVTDWLEALRPDVMDAFSETSPSPHDEGIRCFDVRDMRWVAPGTDNRQPDALAHRERSMPATIEAQRARADLVVVDAPPLLKAAETLALTDLADVVLLVVNQSRSSRTSVERAATALRNVGPRFAGCVLTTGRASLSRDSKIRRVSLGRHARIPAGPAEDSDVGAGRQAIEETTQYPGTSHGASR